MIYFDNAATTSVSEEILNSFIATIKRYPGNSSSNHYLGRDASLIESKAKQQIGRFFNASEDEVIFTSGATESNNLALRGCAFTYQNRGKHIITTKIEHLSILKTCEQLHELYGFDITYLDVDENGVISLDELQNALREDTILVSVMAVNNETGCIEPIEEIGKLLKNYPKVAFHVDATQAIGKISLSYDDVDLLSLSGHKIHSFKASGILLKRKNINLMPQITGGGHQLGNRSGTTNVPVEVSLSKAIRLAFENQTNLYSKINLIRNYLWDELCLIEGIQMNSTKDGSPFILSFSVPKKGSVVAESLSNLGIYVSTKSACSSKKESGSYVLEAMHKSTYIQQNSLRISFSKENTLEEAKEFIKQLKQVLSVIR